MVITRGRTLLWDSSETVKPYGLVLFMKINCLNLTSLNGEIFNLNKRREKRNWVNLVSICYNTVVRKWRSVFVNDLYKFVNLSYFRIKFFKVGNCQNCFYLVYICSFIQIDSFLSYFLFFLIYSFYCFFQSELKHGALGLYS